jgi:hypothetical protein
MGGGVLRGGKRKSGRCGQQCRLPGTAVANYWKAMEILQQWSNAGFFYYVGA